MRRNACGALTIVKAMINVVATNILVFRPGA